ncbi:MAG: hypothetical protein JW770_01750, partial [Actinobacteria bacterium]|nr:hypothetical protein [Actinomycetota bacterium]
CSIYNLGIVKGFGIDMAKKIILGIIITAVLSLTAFGLIYAYGKEKPASHSTASSLATPEYGCRQYYRSLLNGSNASVKNNRLDSGDDRNYPGLLQNSQDRNQLQSCERLAECSNPGQDCEGQQNRFSENNCIRENEGYQYGYADCNSCGPGKQQFLKEQERNENNNRIRNEVK